MTVRYARGLTVLLGFILAALAGTAWGQAPEQQLALQGRILFGFAQRLQDQRSVGGPAATLDFDLTGFWRDPRILQFELRPMVTIGTTVPGTEMGNALSGFSAVGLVLQGSSFPLTLTYSRSSSSLEEFKNAPSANLGVLTGVEIGTTNSVFDANWMLRFRHLPTVNLNYRDTNYSADLPAEFGVGDSRNYRNFSADVNYTVAGLHTGGWYHRTQSTVRTPNVLLGGVQHDSSDTDAVGFNASRSLPLGSTLGVSADHSETTTTFYNWETDTTVRNANASLTSQPFQRLNTTAQVQYTSNLQAFQQQQALAGAGIVGGPSTGPGLASPVLFSFLAPPFDMVTVSGGAALRLVRGLSLNGSAGESHSSNSSSSTRWSAGPSFQHKWRSGSLAASYSHARVSTEAQLLSEIAAGGIVEAPSAVSLSPFSEVVNLNTGAVIVNQILPRQFKLGTSVRVSDGTVTDNGIPSPNHNYGGSFSLTRPVGDWTLTGTFSVDKNDNTLETYYNESTAKGFTLVAAYRGLNLSVGRQYSSGLALQVGDRLLFVGNPAVVSPLLGIPVLSSTTGTTMMGSYHSRRNRLMLRGHWGRFSYTHNDRPASQYSLYNLYASYKLRRLRLIAGYAKQSQAFSIGAPGTFVTRLVYFQIERNFRLF